MAARKPSKSSDKTNIQTLVFDGGKYTGEVKDGELEGRGTFLFNNGDVYEGEFKEGLQSGFGKFHWANGDAYEGDWKNDRMHGKGVMKSVNGNVYEGDWIEGRMEGMGVFRTKDGVYEGQFANDMRHGRGKQIQSSTLDVYEGEWSQDKRHGKGFYRWSNGDTYDGDYRNDLKDGHGVFRWSNGDMYEGEVRNGVRHGIGVYRYSDGRFYAGTFVHGQPDMKQPMHHGGKTTSLTSADQSIPQKPAGTLKLPSSSSNTSLTPVSPAVPPLSTPTQFSTSSTAPNGNLGASAPESASSSCHSLQQQHDAPLSDTLSSLSDIAEIPMINIGTIDLRAIDAPMIHTTSASSNNLSDIHDIKEISISATDLESEEIDLKNWKRGQVLGKGSFGSVYVGALANGKYVAVKSIEFGAEKATEDLAVFEKEMELMKGLVHKNIVRYYGCEMDRELKNVFNIFMEYMPQGTLSAVAKKFNPLPYASVRNYTKQILEVLLYLHSNNIVHRDIKGENILLHNDGTLKLSDFGCSKKLDAVVSRTHGCSTMVGTPYWMAPEVITAEGGYGFKADIWSVGCTIIEMLTAKPPWPEFASMWAAIFHIANSTGPPPGIPDNLPPIMHAFLNSCFERTVQKRPSTQDLLETAFMQLDIDLYADINSVKLKSAKGNAQAAKKPPPLPPVEPPKPQIKKFVSARATPASGTPTDSSSEPASGTSVSDSGLADDGTNLDISESSASSKLSVKPKPAGSSAPRPKSAASKAGPASLSATRPATGSSSSSSSSMARKPISASNTPSTSAVRRPSDSSVKKK